MFTELLMQAFCIFNPPMISRATIDKINETARVEEVVGDFVTLKKRGANLLGLCPFHNEKTPSFTVSPAKGIYKCFGCGAAGNSVNFIMEHEHLGYPEALKYLADKYNIEVEETGGERTAEEQIQLNEKEAMYIVSGFAQRFYTDQLLNTEEGRSIGLSYFKERGFSQATVEKFQLGWAPNGKDELTQAALKAGYKLEILKKAGLTSDKYETPMDFFRSRVQFTIHNFSGKVVGFGGRTLLSDKKVPKYVNTQETEIYNKSKILYGLFFAKTAIRKADECILVEGYTDVISMHQAGIENVVASSGTSLTEGQVQLIKRLTQNITIIYDGDPAGIKAALRGIDLILEEDMNVRVVALPEGEDPDSYVKSVGATAFDAFKDENSKDFILFKTSLLLDDAGTDPVKRSEVIRDIVTSIQLIPDAIKRSLYIQECSKLLDISEQILITEVNKLTRQRLAKARKGDVADTQYAEPVIEVEHEQAKPGTGKSAMLRQERDIIRLLLEYGHMSFDEGITVSHVILHDLEEDAIEFEQEVCRKILDVYKQADTEETPVPESKLFLGHEDREISSFAIELMHSPYEVSPNWDKMHDIIVTDVQLMFKKDIRSSLCRFKLEKVNVLIKENKEAIRKATEEKNDEEVTRLLTRQRDYKNLHKQLAEVLGTVILR